MNNDSREIMPSVDAVRWLIASANQVLSQDLPSDPVLLSSRLKQQHGAQRGRMLSQLSELRLRAKRKFTLADRMFFTRRSLEQATDEMIAHYKAARFQGLTRLADLCAGIGGDAIALGQIVGESGTITLVEKVPQLCQFALANLHAHGITDERSKLICRDLRQVHLGDYQAWHLDPDRRPQGQRRSSPEFCEPALSEFLRRDRLPAAGAVKLAPAADTDGLLSRDVELEWIGHGRECQQQVAWFGDLARMPGKRTATILHDDRGTIEANTIVEEPVTFVAVCEKAQQYVYEPAAPVLAAGLENVLAHQYGLSRLSPSAAYFTSHARVESPHLSGFEVMYCLPFRKKAVKQRLSKLDLRVTEVKKRGVNVDPAALLRELANVGEVPSTLLLYAVRRSIRVVIARRLSDSYS